MNYLLYSLGILIISGLLSFWLSRFVKLANAIGAVGAVSACAIGLTSLFAVYKNGCAVLNIPWSVPFGSFSITVDFIGILFLFPVFILCALSALYGFEYLRHYYGEKNIGGAWFYYNLLVVSIVLVVTAANAILFLLAWEMMSVSSFFLVLFDSKKKETVKAALLYLIAAHIGTLFLLVMFILLGQGAGSFNFADWKTAGFFLMPSVIFICAVIGFGTKAGFVPMHIWLPEAHPAAPSYVSAVMSGVMIKTGIYGIVRILTFLGMPYAWWGYVLIAIGIISGIFGVLFALAQHDIKRLLAYHSIENIGIISIGIGMGVLGISVNNPILTVAGFTGGLLHVINHAFFKGLLFLGAGCVQQGTGTREIDVLGGLLKKMPVTGFCFLIGAAAISGLPPLNGFISEFLIYFASFKNIFGTEAIVFISLGVIASLALIGTLATACFTKAFGIIFLGEARSVHCQKAREKGLLMCVPMVILAGICILIGLGFPFIIGIFAGVIVDITGWPLDIIRSSLSDVIHPLIYIVAVVWIFYFSFLLIAGLRRKLLEKRSIEKVTTWDCGYAYVTPRMQYTASSFAQPIVDFFKGILRTHKSMPKIDEYFPERFSFKTKTVDIFSETVFRPVVKAMHQITGKLTLIQHGHLQIYVLYILVTLVALFVWKF